MVAFIKFGVLEVWEWIDWEARVTLVFKMTKKVSEVEKVQFTTLLKREISIRDDSSWGGD